MATVPNRKQDMINFFATRVPIWSADPAAVGLTAELCAELSAKLSAAQDDLANQNAKKAAQKAATTASNESAQDLRSFGGKQINTIRAFAENGGGTTVYSKAQIPAPADPGPAPAPGEPYDLDADLDNNGHVVLTWKADAASAHTGVFFEIRRKLDGENSFSLLASTGTKTFTDQAIASGTASAVYNVTAKRGELSSPTSENIYVPFAGGGNGPVAIKSAASKAATTTRKKDSDAA
ncbi:MAG: hypothetical protein RIE32_02105 [Phycisphaerales bacterium]